MGTLVDDMGVEGAVIAMLEKDEVITTKPLDRIG
jgi:hypothetical protein